MNNRRQLVVALGASALGVSFGSFAQQQGKVWRVGFLGARRPDSLDTDYYGAFPRGMRELGYFEGKNLVIDWRFADGKYSLLPGLAEELLHLKVDVIVAAGSDATRAAKKATSTVPIVMASVGDPVGSGLVASLAHPGGNISGLSNLNSDIAPKQFELLLSVVPDLSRVAFLANPVTPSYAATVKNVKTAAQRARVTILPIEARNPQEIESAFSMMVMEKVGAIIVLLDALYTQQRRQIADLAAGHRLPSISNRGEYVEAGGLMSYGQNQADNFRRAATYVHKILRGARPADLPVEQPLELELVINRRTAKALGLTIPGSLVISANKLVE